MEVTQTWSMYPYSHTYQQEGQWENLQIPEQHLQACRRDYFYFLFLHFLMGGQDSKRNENST